MRKSFISVLLCLAIVLSFGALATNVFADDIGTTYYIDSVNGDNSNNGLSPDSAWRTLKKASEMTYSEGDSILLKAGGIYTDPFIAKGSGTAENPITLSSYGNAETDGKPMIFSNKVVTLMTVHNVSGWVIENLELSAPNGRGIYITADGDNGRMGDITVRNCELHDIFYKGLFKDNPWNSYDVSAIRVENNDVRTRMENITLSGLNIYNCAHAIDTHGAAFAGWRPTEYKPDEYYNRNFVIEDIACTNILYDGIRICAVNGAVARNISMIKASMLEENYTAPLWLSGCKNVIVENSEIADSANIKDGMAIDFDAWTTDSTYQYIYSHDNICFVRSCVYDSSDYDVTAYNGIADTADLNANCTVRYCLSVNDNKTEANVAQCCSDNARYMDNFKFYNNTIINGSSFTMWNLRNSYVANNIFCAEGVTETIYTTRFFNGGNSGIEKHSFTGTFTNNCFYGFSAPAVAKNSFNTNPHFVGTDFTDKNSFMLSKDSKLIGKGVQVEENMGEHDFYGNPLTEAHNIGCYEGTGEETDSGKCFFKCIGDFFAKIIACAIGVFKRISHLF